MVELAVEDEYLSVAVEGAKLAVRAAESRPEDFQWKDGKSPVTEADLRAESVVRDHIASRYPSHSIVGEEYDSKEGDGNVQWIIDPIDGTANYVHAVPQNSCSMIAVVVDDELHCGVIMMHGSRDVYYAVSGEGAYKNHERISVNVIETLSDSLIVMGSPSNERQNESEVGKVFDFYELVWSRSMGVRMHGCSGVSWAMVAEGRYSGFCHPSSTPWDMAAGALLVQEAGGTVTSYEGQSTWDDLSSEPVTVHASNGEIHEEIRKCIQDAKSD